MKKLIWLLPVMVLFIVGCASTPEIKTVEKIITKKVIEKKLPLNINAPVPLELTQVEWISVTRENIDEVALLFQGRFLGHVRQFREFSLFVFAHGLVIARWMSFIAGEISL